MLGRSVHFDFDGPPPNPDYLVDGLFERDTITMMSADSGVGKSMIMKSIVVAGMQGKPWLGRKTNFKRAMVIDEENPLRVVTTRLRAFGMTNEDRANLRYFLRLGVQLGGGDWAERVRDEMDAFHPDLLVIDTVAAATDVDMNDNSNVAKLYARALRPLANGTAVVLLHHERKPATGTKRNAGHAMMGARQWAGQADAHVALEKLGDVQIEPAKDGGEIHRYAMQLEMPKDRDGGATKEKVALLSYHAPGTRLAERMRVEKVG